MATARQAEIAAAVEKHGSNSKAAKALGMDRRNVDRAMRKMKADALHGHAPGHWNHGTAPGFAISKVTVQRGPNGEVERTWDRVSPEKEQIAEAIQAALDGLKFKPAPAIKAPRLSLAEMLTLYTLTDYHLGMYASAAESGEVWDLPTAKKTALEAVTDMAEGSPDSEEAILNLQGDFLHYDGLEPVTPTNRNVLDASGRYGEMIELALDLVMHSIEILLKKHKRVRLLVCEGNHDLYGSAWMRRSMALMYRKNKRLSVDETAIPFYAYLHGKTMLAWHHGHKVKNSKLPGLFASEPRFRAMWGQADYTYIHAGHLHHAEQQLDEAGGAVVERHPTLSARDAYAARGGHINRRAAHAITYCKRRGEVSRKSVYPHK